MFVGVVVCFSGVDFNNDGVVDFVDFVVLMENFGKIGVLFGDFNGDCWVDDVDFKLFSC